MSVARDFLATAAAGRTPWKITCLVASDTNITLAGLQTIDDQPVVAGDRVLVTGQTDKKRNGIYDAATGAWQRAPDMAKSERVQLRMRIPVAAGTAHGRSEWELIAPTSGAIQLNLTELEFRRLGHIQTATVSGAYTAAVGDLVAYDTTGGAFSITMPDATASAGSVIPFLNLGDDTNALTLLRSGSDSFELDGFTSVSMRTSPGSSFHLAAENGIWFVRGISRSPVTDVKTTDYTAKLGEIVLVDPTSGPLSITMPSAVGAGGQIVGVKNHSASANTVTVIGTIDGVANPTIAIARGSIKAQSDNANWFVPPS